MTKITTCTCGAKIRPKRHALQCWACYRDIYAREVEGRIRFFDANGHAHDCLKQRQNIDTEKENVPCG